MVSFGSYDVTIVISLFTIFTFRVSSPIKQQETPATILVHRQTSNETAILRSTVCAGSHEQN
jgi:hypothetical protein